MQYFARFQLTARSRGPSATAGLLVLIHPPHLFAVATLPCETFMSENSDNLKHNSESQSSVATHLRCGGFIFPTELSFELSELSKK